MSELPVAGDIRTIPELVRFTTREHSSREAIVSPGLRLTYSALDEQSATLALRLLAAGVGKYSRIALHAPNSPEWVIAWMAITRIGAVAVPISTFSAGPELVRILRRSDCHGLIVGGSRWDATVELLTELVPEIQDQSPVMAAALPALRFLAAITPGPDGIPHVHRLGSPERTLPPDMELLFAAEDEVHPSDPATIVFTSGTTSDPKGVVHSHEGVTAQAEILARELGIQPTARSFTMLPFFWVGGLAMSLLPSLLIGAVSYTMEGFDPSAILELIEREQITRILVYPERNVAAIVAHPDYRTKDLSSLQRGVPGLPVQYTAATGVSSTVDGLTMGLGMSETFSAYWWGTPDAQDPVTPPLERLSPGWELKVVDDHGVAVGEGEVGEIAVRGPSLTIGLDKENRDEVFEAGGFYRTGDLGLVAGGAVRFRGRRGGMIRSSGANVSSAEVTEALRLIPGVAAAHVVGLPDEEKGSVVAAAVVSLPGTELEPAAVRDEVGRSLASYKVPSVLEVLSETAIPQTATGKVDERALALLLAERRARRSPSGAPNAPPRNNAAPD